MHFEQFFKIPHLGSVIGEQLYNVTCRPKKYVMKYGGATARRLDGKSIVWSIKDEKGSVADHVEMSGEKVSTILSYGKKANGTLKYNCHVVFPSVRIMKNMTSSALCANFRQGNSVLINGIPLKNEKLFQARFNGTLELNSLFLDEIEIKRTFYPSSTYPASIEKVEIINKTKEKLSVSIKAKKGKRGYLSSFFADKKKYFVRCSLASENGDFRSEFKKNDFEKILIPNGRCVYYNVYFVMEKGSEINFNAEVEKTKRDKQIAELTRVATLTTPAEEINTLFALSLLRGEESIFNTKAGLLHSPGGGRYYAAIWANDQMEYALPAFPFYNYSDGITAGKNSISLYESFMQEGKPLPSSIISEGLYSFGIAGDRGDSAMVGYGLARFLLTNGDKELARNKLELLNYCIDFSLSKMTADGVIASDSDELEGRFPSGKCNLSTNCLVFDMLNKTEIIERELGNTDKADKLKSISLELEKNIIKYFSANVEGVETYRYFEGCEILRSWSCLPLTVGIKGREDGVIDGVFNKLYSKGKLKTASNSKVVWDRSLLFALRGGFMAGYADKMLDKLLEYSKVRLLGEHSPYPYEAYPEGKGSQLAAESLLYTRIIVEGIFGISPNGFKSIKINPSLPSKWKEIKLSGIRYAQVAFDITVTKKEILIKQGSKQTKLDYGDTYSFQ